MFAMVPLFLLIVAAEIAVRLMWSAPEQIGHFRYAKDPEKIYEHVPGTALLRSDVEYRFDQNGAVNWGNPADAFRIAVIGDSVTFQSTGANFARCLFDVLVNDPAARPVVVSDYSVIGYQARQKRIVLEEDVAPADPDLTILALCENDNGVPLGLVELPLGAHPAGIGARLHSRLIMFLAERVHRTVAARAGTREGNAEVRDLLTRLSRAAPKTRSLVLIYPPLSEPRSCAEPPLRGVIAHAERLGLRVIGCTGLTGEGDLHALQFSETDDGHLNERGHRVVAERVASRLRAWRQPGMYGDVAGSGESLQR